jgi:hypothetical protein
VPLCTTFTPRTDSQYYIRLTTLNHTANELGVHYYPATSQSVRYMEKLRTIVDSYDMGLAFLVDTIELVDHLMVKRATNHTPVGRVHTTYTVHRDDLDDCVLEQFERDARLYQVLRAQVSEPVCLRYYPTDRDSVLTRIHSLQNNFADFVYNGAV